MDYFSNVISNVRSMTKFIHEQKTTMYNGLEQVFKMHMVRYFQVEGLAYNMANNKYQAYSLLS